MTTLDALIKRYGKPHFVKIDVEGYEAEVLRGLTHQVPVVSFEFQCADLTVAADSVARIEELGPYLFNATRARRGISLARGESCAP